MCVCVWSEFGHAYFDLCHKARNNCFNQKPKVTYMRVNVFDVCFDQCSDTTTNKWSTLALITKSTTSFSITKSGYHPVRVSLEVTFYGFRAKQTNHRLETKDWPMHVRNAKDSQWSSAYSGHYLNSLSSATNPLTLGLWYCMVRVVNTITINNIIVSIVLVLFCWGEKITFPD